ncbi:MAG: GH3 auxin-responsive promoter family protein [Bacteroidetes bacterium]|nr:GH3 auxin-responsive promoter family protein [Bacteroidota bacterium]
MPANRIFHRLIVARMPHIGWAQSRPADAQRGVYLGLIHALASTKYGRELGIQSPHDVGKRKDFVRKVPVVTYDELKPWIARAREGESSVLWPGVTKWFAQSSGTTSDQFKWLPVTSDSLHEGHYKGGKDLLAQFCNQVPEAQLYQGKHLILGGSSSLVKEGGHALKGDLSAIIVRHLPPWCEARRTPSRDIALMDRWEEKVEAIAEATLHEDVRILAGVPSWMSLVAQRVLEKSGETNLRAVWPNLWLYMHGGVGFAPYRDTFQNLIPNVPGKPPMHYLETYNASEGFFAYQDDLNRDDMALLMDHGIYYEFVPMEELGKSHPDALEFREVEEGQTYALVISTNAGLWRYLVGDLVTVTSKIPLRIQVSGRISSFLNLVGEEVMEQQTDRALADVCSELGTQAYNYIAGPVLDDFGKPVGHRWVVEFQAGHMHPPASSLGKRLDAALQALNGDYKAKRTADLALMLPEVKVVPSGTFDGWLRSRNRLGGQHKVPRLTHHESTVLEVLEAGKRELSPTC